MNALVLLTRDHLFHRNGLRDPGADPLKSLTDQRNSQKDPVMSAPVPPNQNHLFQRGELPDREANLMNRTGRGSSRNARAMNAPDPPIPDHLSLHDGLPGPGPDPINPKVGPAVQDLQDRVRPGQGNP